MPLPARWVRGWAMVQGNEGGAYSCGHNTKGAGEKSEVQRDVDRQAGGPDPRGDAYA
jgi:hypothetical protein